MKYLIILVSLLSPTVFASEYASLIEDHCQRLEVYEDINLNILNEQVRKVLDYMDKHGQVSGQMLDYFSKHPIQALALRNTSIKAEKLSRQACGLALNSPRHVDDEVDAVRHIIWSSLLTLRLGKETALDIMSMNENKPIIDKKETYMDLANNKIGVDYATRNGRSLKRMRVSHKQNNRIIRFAKEQLAAGKLKVWKSKPSACQLSPFYPNM